MSTSPAELRSRAEEASAALPALVLSAERLSAMLAPGEHGLRRAGMGEDFWQYRPASSGDTARSIDWRRSARSDSQFVRDREAQSAQTVSLWVATGPGMRYSGDASRATKMFRSQVLALALGMVLLRGGERVGLLGLPARQGRAHAGLLARQLLAQAADASRNEHPGISLLRPNQRVVLFSDFLDDPSWLDPFIAQAAGSGMRGALVQVLDPDEENFPFGGAITFRSPGGDQRHDSRDAAGLRDAYLTRLAERRDWLNRQSGKAGWYFTHHVTDQAPAHVLGWLYQALGR